MPKTLSLQDVANLSRFDLNLIVVFELIFLHGSLTKTAESLNVSVPAISKSLSKLRRYFQDPLFIKNKHLLSPTIVAEHIHKSLASNLSSINQVVNIGSNLVERKTFSIYAPPTITSRIVTKLNTLYSKLGHNLELIHHNIYTIDCDIEDLFRYRKADIAISLTPVFSPQLICKDTKSKKFVIVCGERYDVGSHISADELLNHNWITTLANDALIQMELASFTKAVIKGQRNVIFSTDSALPLFSALQFMNGIGIISAEMMELFGEHFKLRTIEPDFELPEYNYKVISQRNYNDHTLQELITGISGILNDTH